MTDANTQKARNEAYFLADFAPNPNTQLEFKGPVALEYIAFQMGRIRAALEEINAREKLKFEREETARTKETQKRLRAAGAKVERL